MVCRDDILHDAGNAVLAIRASLHLLRRDADPDARMLIDQIEALVDRLSECVESCTRTEDPSP